MNTQEKRIQDWARECGYTGLLPKDMTSFYNESTLHIWDDIIAKVQSRNTVEKVSYNLLIHRLKSGIPINKALPREYDIYHELKTLTILKDDTLTRINDKEVLLKKSQKQIKTNQFELERTKASAEELDVKIFLLQEKMTSFTADTAKIQRIAIFLENAAFSNFTHQTKLTATFNKHAKNINNESNEQLTQLQRNKNDIFNEIFVSEANLLRDLQNTVEKHENTPNTNKIKYNDESFNLYAKCLEHQIEALILDKSIETLQLSVQKHRTAFNSNVLAQKCPGLNTDSTIKMFDRQAKITGLIKTDTLLTDVINSLRQQLATSIKNSNSLQHITTNHQFVIDTTDNAIKNISTKLDEIAQREVTIETTRAELRAAVQMLSGINLDYLLPLTGDIVSKELLVFRCYPLYYYKQCHIGGKSHYTRNDYLFSHAQSDLLSELNVHPLQTPSELLISLHADLQWLYHLTATAKCTSALLTTDIKPASATMDFKQISHSVQMLVDNLKSAKQQLNLVELQSHKKRFQEMLTLWSDMMKFGAFISTDRLFNDENYATYESEFMRYFNVLR